MHWFPVNERVPFEFVKTGSIFFLQRITCQNWTRVRNRRWKFCIRIRQKRLDPDPQNWVPSYTYVRLVQDLVLACQKDCWVWGWAAAGLALSAPASSACPPATDPGHTTPAKKYYRQIHTIVFCICRTFLEFLRSLTSTLSTRSSTRLLQGSLRPPFW